MPTHTIQEGAVAHLRCVVRNAQSRGDEGRARYRVKSSITSIKYPLGACLPHAKHPRVGLRPLWRTPQPQPKPSALLRLAALVCYRRHRQRHQQLQPLAPMMRRKRTRMTKALGP